MVPVASDVVHRIRKVASAGRCCDPRRSRQPRCEEQRRFPQRRGFVIARGEVGGGRWEGVRVHGRGDEAGDLSGN